ncbi:serine hydrolase domain-containing protein [Sediminispirochaeta bajacaliforniensis]|uniref:serine hydrolase domain-containing protein n=1 Tax=Sediminispirochaeta bajacaliforniensis TaxID=148 RepID=UPI0003632F9F|nr:serine hydrolase domain-containing protein [Sediminispirochaeta bajacaliforniensis]
MQENNGKTIETMLDEAIADRTTPGFVLLVKQHGKVVFSKTAGYRRLYPYKEEMTSETIFDLASLTKPLATTTTALAVMEQEKISPDTEIGAFLPSLRRETASISLGQLFTHTSGLPPVPDIFKLFETEAEIDRAKAIGHLFSLTPTVKPGAQVIYSCTGYILLAEAVKKITGENMDELFRQLVTTPGEIDSLLFNPLRSNDKEIKENIAATEYCPWRDRWLKGEVHDENAFCLGGMGGNAGLFGNAEGIMKLLELFSSGGMLNGKHILSEESVRLMTGNQTQGLSPKRAFGFLVQDRDSFAGPLFSPEAFGHTGFTGTSVWMDPSLDLKVVLLTNRVHFGRAATAEKIKTFRKNLHSALSRAFS